MIKRAIAIAVGMPLLLGACTAYVPPPAYTGAYQPPRPTVVQVNPVPVYTPAPVYVYDRPFRYHYRYWHEGRWHYQY